MPKDYKSDVSGKYYFRYPGSTANSVRWAFWEPEKAPLKGTRIRDAIAGLENIIRLPYDVQAIIFDMVHELPSWVHLKFKNWSLEKVVISNHELYANKEWNQEPRLRRDLSRSDPSDSSGIGALASNVLHTLVANRANLENLQDQSGWGDSPFFVKIQNEVKTPQVKRRIDWFLIEGGMEFYRDDSIYRNLIDIRTIAFTLDEAYEFTQQLIHTPIPVFVLDSASQVEEVVIIVGDLQSDIPPSKMQEIDSYQVDKIGNFNHPNLPHNISNAENYMIRAITNKWEEDISERRGYLLNWLRDDIAQDTQAYPIHDHLNQMSKWLASPCGIKWLEMDGSAFLRTPSG
ncbi:uncharacterized protein F4822DRAFT_429273 [Hypoxylon trugodes]|uniref:uncharacterized protein n=1 Tax=Hypoxylon trugodes TaxID=326681 RepID=UPI00218D878C|nr:uncharacterized protein F4822DRAFT_429273 [Hypoxylon trugodes]KAI1388657.1 hypothetical protein F4822DRAFT_429273 [Hypoxylon trugodes]